MVRWFPALVLVAVLLLLVITYLLDPANAYRFIARAFGFEPFYPPFIDTKGVLAASECWLKGVDVYRSNPCDPLGRVHLYSPLLIYVFAVPGLRLVSLNAVGITLVLMFLLSIILIFRPEDRRSAVLGALGAISGPAIFALERGQFEILILFFTVLFCVLHERSFPRRCVGYVLALIVGLLKFFPIALFALAAREKRGRMLSIIGLGLGVFGAVFLLYRDEYREIARHIHRCGSARDSFWCNQFWVANLAFWFLERDSRTPLGLVIHMATVLAFLIAVVALARFIHRHGFRASPADRDVMLFAGGSLLLLSSFLIAPSSYYRAIHLILTLPLLMTLSFEQRVGRRSSLFARGLFVITLLLLWMGPVGRATDFIGYQLHAIDRPLHTGVALLREVAWVCGVAGLGAVTAVILFEMLKHRQNT